MGHRQYFEGVNCRTLQQSSGAIEILRRDRAQRFVGNYRLTLAVIVQPAAVILCSQPSVLGGTTVGRLKSHAGGVASHSAASSAKKCSAVGLPQLIVVLCSVSLF